MTAALATMAAIRERENTALVAEALQREQLERERERERLRDSLLEQAKAERLAGNRYRSLETLRKAAEIRRDEELRVEATLTIMKPGLRRLGEVQFDTTHLSSWTLEAGQAISNGKLAALWWAEWVQWQPGIEPTLEMRELSAGKRLAVKKGPYAAAAFRPGTSQIAIVRSLDKSPVWLWDSNTDQEVGPFDEPGEPLDVAFSTDGSLLLTERIPRSENLPVQRVWDLATKKELPSVRRGKALGFLSSDELLLDIAGSYGVWNCRNGKERLPAPKTLKAACANGPGKLAGYSLSAGLGALRGRLAGKNEEGLFIWDLAAGKQIGEIPALTELPSRVDFSPNRRYAVCKFPADKGKSLRVWDLQFRRFIARLNCPGGFLLYTYDASYGRLELGQFRTLNADGSLLAAEIQTERGQQALCIWDVAAGTVLATLPGVIDHSWSTDPNKLIARSALSISWWEVTPPALCYDVGTTVTGLSLNKVGDRLAVNDFLCGVVAGARGPEIGGWDAAPSKELFRPIVLRPGQNFVVLGGGEDGLPQFVGKEECWSFSSAVRRDSSAYLGLDIPVFGASIIGLTGSPAGLAPLLAHGTLPRTFELQPTHYVKTALWQLAPQSRQVTLPPADYPEQAALEQKRAFDAKDLCSYQLDGMFANNCVFAPEKPLLLRNGVVVFRKVEPPWTKAARQGFTTSSVGSSEGVFELWNYQTGQRLAMWKQYPAWFQFSPDGRRFAKIVTGALEIWDTAGCQIERTIQAKGQSSFSDKATLSPDGRRLLALYTDRVGMAAQEHAGLFDVDTGQELLSWSIKPADWQAFAISPDGTLVASGGEEKLIRLWDASTGRELARWQCHEGDVTTLVFGRDGQTLYSGSQDGTLKIWNLAFLRKELKELQMDW